MKLNAELKDAEKDRLSLRYAKSRLGALRATLTGLERSHGDLERKYAEAETEREELYTRFEGMVHAARTRADAKNEVLEKRLAEAETEYLTRRAQVQEVMVTARVDPGMMAVISGRLDTLLESRNAMIRELQHSVATLTKAHNDAVRVLETKLRDMGLPAEDTTHSLLPSHTGVGPAGLVARPGVV